MAKFSIDGAKKNKANLDIKNKGYSNCLSLIVLKKNNSKDHIAKQAQKTEKGIVLFLLIVIATMINRILKIAANR